MGLNRSGNPGLLDPVGEVQKAAITVERVAMELYVG